MTKCICGYEHSVDCIDPENNRGDKEFITVFFGKENPDNDREIVNVHRACIRDDYYPGGKKPMRLVACPECGTIKLEESW